MSAPLLLEGVKVLTLEQVHALPWGTAFLADLGAQVIRIGDAPAPSFGRPARSDPDSYSR